ncbi:Ulp1 protease family, catalytic domain protein [Trichuris suis]|nr:Ulp1 protease family, catalytic domain protein [Trichuris suis]
MAFACRFSSFESELRSRIGELLSCFKESAEKEIKSKGIFPECSLELPDERAVLLRKLADSAFLELSEDQTKEVIAQWSNQDKPNEVLAKLCSIPVTRADLRTLMGYNWLNDELLVSRSKAVAALPTLQRSGHAGVCKWTKDVDIFSYDLLFIPIHLSNHWVLTVVDVKERFVKYYDSLGASGRNCLLIIGDYLEAEMKDKKSVDMDRATWRFQTEDCPRQGNCSDCGMFVLKYAEFLSREAPLTFTQEHMPSFRIRVAYEILHERLL